MMNTPSGVITEFSPVSSILIISIKSIIPVWLSDSIIAHKPVTVLIIMLEYSLKGDDSICFSDTKVIFLQVADTGSFLPLISAALLPLALLWHLSPLFL